MLADSHRTTYIRHDNVVEMVRMLVALGEDPATGTGATAHVYETLINLQMKFAFG